VETNRRVVAEPDEALDQLAREVIGAAIEVHRILGPGLLETVYENALCIQLGLRQIPFTRQPAIGVTYKGHPVGQSRPDFLVGDSLVVELKAVDGLHDIHKAQVISYLKSSGHRLGLLINFNVAVLRDGIKRIVVS
jgi:GxxExxY protein